MTFGGLTLDKEIEINSIIREYFLYSNYNSTIPTFDGECSKRGRPASSARNNRNGETEAWIEQMENKFLITFYEGDRQSFFSLWDKNFTAENIRVQDPISHKLEFTLNVYFALFPILPHTKNSNNATIEETMNDFKAYLSTRGADLCKTTQFLSFYALPYVPDPRQHPSFKDLFKPEWQDDVKDRMVEFLTTALRKRDLPRIAKIMESKDIRTNEEYQKSQNMNVLLKARIREYEEKGQNITNKHRSLQADYHNLIMIASELVQALAASVNGEEITPDYLSSIFQRLSTFKKTHEKRNQESTPEFFAKEAIEIESIVPAKYPPPQAALSIMKEMNGPSDASPPGNKKQIGSSGSPSKILAGSLSIPKIRADFENHLNHNDAEESRRSVILLLDCISSHVLSLDNMESRKRAVQDFASGDLFGLNSNKSVIESIFETDDTITRHHLARLINIIATESAGRAYLLCQTEDAGNSNSAQVILKTLVEFLMDEAKGDSVYKQNLIGALQKLSLRRYAQSALIQMEIVPTLVDLLENIEGYQLSEYTVEYTSALLMNLVIRQAGKKACSDEQIGCKRILKLLCSLLRYENHEVKSYAISSIYNLLSEIDIKQQAMKMGLADILEETKYEADEQISSQVDFVIELIESERDEDGNEDEESEDGEEEDFDDHWEIEEHMINDMSKNSVSSEQGGSGRDFANQLLAKYVKTAMAAQETSDETPRQFLKKKTSVVRQSSNSLRESVASDMRKPKTPASRPMTPLDDGPPLVPHAAPAAYDSIASRKSSSLNEKMSAKNLEQALSENKRDSVDSGLFETRSKIARTPLTASLSSMPVEMSLAAKKAAAAEGGSVRSSVSSFSAVKKTANSSISSFAKSSTRNSRTSK